MIQRAAVILNAAVLVEGQKMPFERFVKAPFLEGRKLRAHEIELLARMRELIAQKQTKLRKLGAIAARHFCKQRPLAVDDFVVR